MRPGRQHGTSSAQPVRGALVAVALFALCASSIPLASAAQRRNRWRLVWSEEFSEGARPDQKTWTYQLGDACQYLSEDYFMCGWGNGEMQFYTGRPQNVRIENGKLVIEARRELQVGEATSITNRFTSARINTEGSFAVRPTKRWKTIKLEARIKIPQGTGLWPAFWMLPTFDETALGMGQYGRWAASGEIDIMEAVNNMSQLHGTIHYGNSWPGNLQATGVLDTAGASAKGVETPFADRWHTYAVEWEATQIRWYVDGKLYSTKNSASSTEGGWFSGANNARPNSPFDRPFHIVLNMAVGGGFVNYDLGRVPSYDEVAATLAEPKQMLVDWVRVYRRKN